MMSSTSPTTFAAGRYRVQRLLGESSRKSVYLAHDTRFDRAVAFAVFKTEAFDQEARARVRRESRAMGRLGDHPHIVTIRDVGEEEGALYIVAEYMAGGDVKRLLHDVADHRLPVAEALRLAAEVASALEHAHDRGVIHRNLKPGNIWLTADGTVKLGDFGLAITRTHSRLTLEGMIVGTAAYMAPEQALGRMPDARSDLYALGALLYELVAGRPPFLGDDAVAIVSQHFHTRPVAPSWHNPAVPQALEALILQLLAKAPEDRPPSAAAVRAMLAGISGSRPLATGGATTAPADEHRGVEPNPLGRLAGGIFVGRERELKALREAVEEAVAGSGRLLLLAGEPGIGKTRTAQELATYARLRGLQVLWGGAHEGGGAPPYWPWVKIIRAYVQDHSPEQVLAKMGAAGAVDIAQVVPAVRACLPSLPPPPPVDAEEARFRLFESITTFFRNAAAEHPLLLVLDDLHWADPGSLLVLQFLAREMADSRLVVIGTYRDTEIQRPHPLFHSLGELARAPGCRRCTLAGLSRPDVARYIELTATCTPSAALVDVVARETEGNPFFLGEVVRLLAAEGRFEHPGQATAAVPLPAAVREVIGRRLDRLSVEGNRVLATAAVVGREFEVDVLARVTELPPGQILEVLEDALATGIIIEVPRARRRYSFAHALIRETLYQEFTATRRAALHRRIAEALEELSSGVPESRLAELAYHFFEAAEPGNAEKALVFATRAGDRAMSLLAYEEAAFQYDRGLQALELGRAVDDEQRCELLLALGEAELGGGFLEKARAEFWRAADVARRLAAPEPLARAALGVGMSYGWSEMAGPVDEKLVGLLEEARSALGEQDSVLRARVQASLAIQLYFTGVPERTASLTEGAVEIARRTGGAAALAYALHARQYFLWGSGTVEQRLAIATEMLQVAKRTTDSRFVMWAHAWRIVIFLEIGERAAADREIEAQSRIGEALRQPLHRYHAVMHEGMQALLDGRFEDAEQRGQQLLEIGGSTRSQDPVLAFGAQRFVLLREQGRLDEMEAGVKAFVQEYPGLPAWRAALCLIYAELDREAEARVEFEQLAADDFAQFPRDTNWPAALSMLAEVCAFLRDSRRARMLHDLMLPYASRCVVISHGTVCLGSMARGLGMLAATLGRWEEADGHFEDALQTSVRMSAGPAIARTQLDHASMLIARDEPGDLERALGLLTESLAAAQTLGMKALLERALALKLRVQGVVAGAATTSIDAVAATVRRERPDLRSHAAPDGTVTILFTDLEGSTAMIERLGDHRAQALLRTHNALIREQVAAHGGFEVKAQGDGFMLAFASARRALLCAVAVQRALARYNARHPEAPMRVRIGLHTGEVIHEANDFFGKNVVLAARIAAQARGGEILVSALVKELTESAGEVQFGGSRTVELKGIVGSRTVHDVLWAGEAASGVADTPSEHHR